jgi:hypothetical protein
VELPVEHSDSTPMPIDRPVFGHSNPVITGESGNTPMLLTTFSSPSILFTTLSVHFGCQSEEVADEL